MQGGKTRANSTQPASSVYGNVIFKRIGDIRVWSSVSLEAIRPTELRGQREQFPQLKVKPPQYFWTAITACDPKQMNRTLLLLAECGGGMPAIRWRSHESLLSRAIFVRR